MIYNSDDDLCCPESRKCELYIKNETVEFVATLELRGCLGYPVWPEKLVVIDYNREPDVLQSASSSFYPPSTCITVKCIGDSKKLVGFLDYLRKRNKGGRTDNGVFVLASTKDADQVVLYRRPPSASLHSSTAAPLNQPITKTIPVASKQTLILSKEDEIEQVRSSTQLRLKAFVADSSASRLEFSPMNEMLRFIVIDEVSVRIGVDA
jgi:hypothetical protein